MSVVKYGAIESLKDVSITNLAVGDYLRYEKDGYWKNVTASVEGGTGSWTEDKLTTFVVKLINSEGGTKFVSKVNDDTVNGSITFKSATIFEADTTVKDVYYGNFTSGLTGVGGKIDSHGDAELNSLTLRESLTVPTLNYNRITVTSGETWQTVCCGEIESVDGNLATIKLEDGESSGITYNDICRAIYHNADGNADTTVDDCGFEQLQGFDTVYFKVTEVLDSGKQFKFELKPGSTPPLRAHMKFVVYGNFTDSDRQDSAYQTKQYTRFLKGVNDWAVTSANVASQFGKLDGLVIDGAPNEGKLTGNGAYINNAYITGSIIELSDAQKAELQGYSLVYRDRGLFDIDSTYYYDKATNVPDYEQDDATPIAKDNILIRDYVYDENGSVYTVKSYSTSNTGKALTEDCWQSSTTLGLVSINTLLAKSGKLGAFTFDDNTFASTNGKLSMNSETGKLIAKEAQIENSTLKNIVYSKKSVTIKLGMADYLEQNEDGTTYSLYNSTTEHSAGTLVSSNVTAVITTDSYTLLSEITVQPENCTEFNITYSSNDHPVTLRLPENYNAYNGTEINVSSKTNDYVNAVNVIVGTKVVNKYGYNGGPNYLPLGASGSQGISRYTFLSGTNGWCISSASVGQANEKTVLTGTLVVSKTGPSFTEFNSIIGRSSSISATAINIDSTSPATSVYTKSTTPFATICFGAYVQMPYIGKVATGDDRTAGNWILDYLSNCSISVCESNTPTGQVYGDMTSEPYTRSVLAHFNADTINFMLTIIFTVAYTNMVQTTTLPDIGYIPFQLTTTETIVLP